MAAARISEVEFASLKRKAGKNVVFSESARPPSSRRPPRSRRRARSTASYGFREVWPVLAAIGGVAALGFVASRESNLHGLGVMSPDQAQNAQIGSALGQALGQMTGIPGLGQLGAVIGSLFGPSVHTDPMGIPQDTVQGVFNETAQELFSQINARRVSMGMQPISFPGIPTPGGAAMASWSTQIMAEVLYEPSLNSSSQDRLAQLREDGTMDAAIAAMKTIMNGLSMPPPPPPVQSYGSVTGTSPPPASQSYQSTAPAPVSATSSIMAWVQANPLLAAGGALVLVLLLASGSGSAPIIVGGSHV